MLILLAGCGRIQLRPKQEEQSKKKVKIAVSTANAQTDSARILKKNLDDGAKKENMEITWLDAQNNALKQQADVEKALGEKIKVLVIEPVNPDLAKSSVQAAQSKGVKIVCLSTLVPDMALDAFISPDYRRAGEIQGQQVLQTVQSGKTFNILILRGGKNDPVAARILEGNLSVLKGNRAVGNLWIEEIDNWNPGTAFETARKYIGGTKPPQAVLAHSPEITMGVLQAVEQQGNRPALIPTFGIGTERKALEAIKKGQHMAEVDCMPEMQAQVLMDTVKSLSRDEPWEYEQQMQNGSNNVPARFTPLRTINKENLYLVSDRMKELEKGQGGQSGGGGGSGGSGGGESGSQGEEGQGQSGGSQKQSQGKTVVRIKTKDGQTFEMNIKGQIESIEVKEEKGEALEGEGEQGQSGDGGGGEEGGSGGEGGG